MKGNLLTICQITLDTGNETFLDQLASILQEKDAPHEQVVDAVVQLSEDAQNWYEHEYDPRDGEVTEEEVAAHNPTFGVE